MIMIIIAIFIRTIIAMVMRIITTVFTIIIPKIEGYCREASLGPDPALRLDWRRSHPDTSKRLNPINPKPLIAARLKLSPNGVCIATMDSGDAGGVNLITGTLFKEHSYPKIPSTIDLVVFCLRLALNPKPRNGNPIAPEASKALRSSGFETA